MKLLCMNLMYSEVGDGPPRPLSSLMDGVNKVLLTGKKKKKKVVNQHLVTYYAKILK